MKAISGFLKILFSFMRHILIWPRPIPAFSSPTLTRNDRYHAPYKQGLIVCIIPLARSMCPSQFHLQLPFFVHNHGAVVQPRAPLWSLVRTSCRVLHQMFEGSISLKSEYKYYYVEELIFRGQWKFNGQFGWVRIDFTWHCAERERIKERDQIFNLLVQCAWY